MTHPLYALVQAAAPITLGSHTTELALAVILGLNAWQLRVTLQFRDTSQKLNQWAFGPEGDNGVNGDVKQLRAKSHHHGDEIHAIRGVQQLHELRLDSVERRHGPEDRREHA